MAIAGADVVIIDIASSIFETAKEIELQKSNVLAIKCDVTNPSDIEKAKNQATEKFRKVDILVNNAGIYPQKSFLEMTEEDWSKVIRINLWGVFYCTKAFLPSMVQRRYGKIVNLSSISGPVVAFPNLVHYSSSKSAIAGFTRARV